MITPEDMRKVTEAIWVQFKKDVSHVREKFCTDCLEDRGLRLMAAVLAEESQTKCVRCGSHSGRRLDAQSLGYVIYRFFVEGSRPGRHMPPVLIVGDGSSDKDIQFTGPLQRDYGFLKGLTGFQLMRNAPNLVRMGISSLRITLETRLGIHDWGEHAGTESIDEAFSQIVDYPVEFGLPPGRLLYRVRLGPRTPWNASEYDAPPTDLAKANRLNPEGVQVFYGALDVETCAFEMKPSLEEIVNEQMYVGTFRAARSLRLFDLLNSPDDFDGPDGPGALHSFLRSLFFPASRDYRISQELAVRVAARGFDGILYPSAYSYIREASAYPNIVLFGAPLSKGWIELLSVNKLLFRGVTYTCEPGPVFIEEEGR